MFMTLEAMNVVCVPLTRFRPRLNDFLQYQSFCAKTLTINR